ncbi:MAG: B12-binding domain-containing radical SAM protein [Endomicrobia bacterium]|nr:B12-binding domain-containing radical SAM protein [Endomicrobiia bacterium]MCL2799846.1 B12-binding domain-containing radical SAM protein [Endomicrobiia bacterium]
MKILLINPPIYDFAAFDLWSAPLGLLYLASILKQQGIEVELLDYMDRANSLLLIPNSSFLTPNSVYGCGHYVKQKIEKPEALKHIPRNYFRYGLPKDLAVNCLKGLYPSGQCPPDLIIFTSVMTYWYPGVFEAIQTVKEIFSDTPVVLGGTYATLCYEHAQKSGADYVLKGGIESLNSNPHLNPPPPQGEGREGAKNVKITIPCSFSDYPIPYYPPNQNKDYAVLRISAGCPFKCSYCAQDVLSGGSFVAKPWEKVFEEIKDFADRGIKNIVFYDDALLYNPEKIIKPLLKKIIESNLKINIHTPNGLHLRYLDLELALLMKKANFVMPRFSLESADARIQKETGAKITNEGFEKAAAMLKEAGYKKGEYLIYLLIGMPGQSLKETESSIEYVHKFGAKISLSEYSVIPGTKDFKKQLGIRIEELGINGKDFANEPLLHNKSVYPLFDVKDWNEIYRIKNLAKELNSLL